MINIIEQIRLMNSFTIKLKPTVIPRLRRMPRGNNCLTDVWHPMVTYIIDPKRSTQEFILFNAIQDHSLCVIYQEPMKVNWWIRLWVSWIRIHGKLKRILISRYIIITVCRYVGVSG